MSDDTQYKVLSDSYIVGLFDGTDFGPHINGNVEEQKRLIRNALENQLAGYWTGRTLYSILIEGGFLHDAKFKEQKKLTQLGEAFLQVERS